MARILLTVVLPIVLPLLLYLGYARMVRRQRQSSGGEDLAPWQKGPWSWLMLSGIGLVIVILAIYRLTTGLPPGTEIEAPRTVDGVVVPSHVRGTQP